jgi:hypothetical protein
MHGDYIQNELSHYMSQTEHLEAVVNQYKRHALGRRGIVFCVGIEHSKAMAQSFNAAGIHAEHLDGTTPDAERASILARLEAGHIDIVTNANVLCEGVDLLSISYIGLARPTQSKALYIQQAGRGLRPCPESGKRDCILIDHGELVETHGHLLDEHEWTLADRDKNAPIPPSKYRLNEANGIWEKGLRLNDAIRRPATTSKPLPNFVLLPEDFTPPKVETPAIVKRFIQLLRFARANGKPARWVAQQIGMHQGFQNLGSYLGSRYAEQLIVQHYEEASHA